MRIFLDGPRTQRLKLRAMCADDAEAFFRLNSHPEVMRFTGEPPTASIAEAKEAINTYPDFEKVGYGRWGCFPREGGHMIGFCGLKYLADINEVDLGYRFLPEYWGRGLATEACKACIKFGFEELALDHIVAFVLPANKASIRVLEKIGMKFEIQIRLDDLFPLQFGIHRKSMAGDSKGNIESQG